MELGRSVDHLGGRSAGEAQPRRPTTRVATEDTHYHHDHDYSREALPQSLPRGGQEGASLPSQPPRSRLHGLSNLIHRLSRQNLQLEGLCNGVTGGQIPSSPTDTTMGSPKPSFADEPEPCAPPPPSQGPFVGSGDDRNLLTMTAETDGAAFTTPGSIHSKCQSLSFASPQGTRPHPPMAGTQQHDTLFDGSGSQRGTDHPPPTAANQGQGIDCAPLILSPTDGAACAPSDGFLITPNHAACVAPPPIHHAASATITESATTSSYPNRPFLNMDEFDEPIEADPDVGNDDGWAEYAAAFRASMPCRSWSKPFSNGGVRKRGPIEYSASADIAQRRPNLVLSRPRMRRRRKTGKPPPPPPPSNPSVAATATAAASCPTTTADLVYAPSVATVSALDSAGSTSVWPQPQN